MEIPRFGNLVVCPRRFLNAWERHSLMIVGRLALRPHVPIAERRFRIAASGLKPWVLVRCVIDDEIDNEPNSVCVAGIREFYEVSKRSVARVDAVIVADVVSVVTI